jgi:hypothetical protein
MGKNRRKIEPVETYIMGFTFLLWGSDGGDEWVILDQFETWDQVVREFKSEQPYSYVMITGGTMAKKERR